MDNAVIIAIIAAIIAPPFTVGLPLAIFQWRQNLAMENRLRAEIKSVKVDLEGDIKSVKSDLEGDIKSVKSDLEGDIQSIKSDLEGSIQSVKSDLEGDIQAVERRLTDRLNRTDDKVDYLIGEVGLVKGAVLGVPTETSPREPATTS